MDRRRLPRSRADAAKENQPGDDSSRTPEILHGFTTSSVSILDAECLQNAAHFGPVLSGLRMGLAGLILQTKQVED
jgi:hypothetical protein